MLLASGEHLSCTQTRTWDQRESDTSGLEISRAPQELCYITSRDKWLQSIFINTFSIMPNLLCEIEIIKIYCFPPLGTITGQSSQAAVLFARWWQHASLLLAC